MPREVFAPGGSPFVQNIPAQQHELSDTDISLPELSSRYFRTGSNPGSNLNSSRALAGLGDISTDMADDDSPMRFRSSGSDEMLMGIKGGEFLADDSAMGFDTSLVSKPFESRSKLNHSTTIPVTVAEEPEPEIEAEQAAKTEKPKRKKSTRSRSKSPSKKSVTPDAVSVAVESGAPFLREPMETMAEVPEPEREVVAPEPEVKPRRTSPRKARTRAPSAAEPPIAPSGTSPFNPFSPPASDPPPPELAPQPTQQSFEVGAQLLQTAKSKRTSRSVGRSKSKTRSKNVPTEEDDPQMADIATSATLAPPIGKERASPDVDQSVPPPAPKAANPLMASVKEASPTAAADDILPPAFVDKYSNIVKPTILEQPPVHARTEPGPLPFKFQALPSAAKSRSKSLTPAEAHTPPVPPIILSTVAIPSLDTPILQETFREPTKEEEAEAVASALHILRRDSSIFPRLRQSIGPNYTPNLDLVSRDNALAVSQELNQAPVQAEPVHKRTRVGRSSTRVRGGAGITVAGGQTIMNHVIEEGQVEVSQKVLETGVGTPAQPSGPVETDGVDEAEPEREQAVEDIVVPVNFGSRTPSPAPAPTTVSPSFGALPEPEPRGAVSDVRTGPIPRSRTSVAPNPSLPSSTGPTGMNDVPAKLRTVRASLPAQITRVSALATRAARMSEGRPTATRNVGSARAIKPKEPELVEEKEDDEKNAEGETEPDPPTVDVSTPASTPSTGDAVQPQPSDNPIVPLEPVPVPEATAEVKIDREPEPEPGLAEDSNAPAPVKPSTQRKALGPSSKGGPQRAAPVTSQKMASSKSGTRVLSGQRSASATEKPSAPTRTTAVAASKSNVATTGEGAPPTVGSTSASSSSARPQRTITTSRKPSSATSASQKPPSASGPTRVKIPQDTTGPALNKDTKTSSSRVAAKNKPEVKARPTRTLSRRVAAASKDQTSAKTEDNEEPALSADVPEGDKGEVISEQAAKETIPEPTKAGPFEHTHGVFQPVLIHLDANNPFASESHTSPPRPNKRRASLEINTEHQTSDSPSKRVRFSAELEAGPTPRAAPGRIKPKPSLKPFAKPKFRLKASRPKRTLTRNKPPTVPSYAAPLKRTVSEQADGGATNSERPPLSESRTNTRSTTNKLKPTVPVEFTFRSELRSKVPVEVPLPNAIPIALPMPDFAAAHAAAEAANLARRERTQAAFLAAQSELEAWRESKHEIGSETARRAAERAVFDAAMKVKEAEAERVRLEAKKLEDEREVADIKELRKRMVPKANPVPEWYKHVGQNEGEGRVDV